MSSSEPQPQSNPTPEPAQKWSSSDDSSSDDDAYLGIGPGPDELGRICSRMECFISIESVKLKINDKFKSSGLQIYGEIKVPVYRGTCIYVYHRHGYEAETVTENDGSGGFDLTLCGPNFPLTDWELNKMMEVSLFEHGGKPFFSDYFDFVLHSQPCHEPITLSLDLPDDRGTLSLCFTKILNSIPVSFKFMVIGQVGDLALVEGSIQAKHCLSYVQPDMTPANWLTLLEKKENVPPVKIPLGEAIPLNRSYFVMPVQSPEADPPMGGSMLIEVNLVLRQEDDQSTYHHVIGQAEIVLNERDKLFCPEFFMVKEDPYSAPKRKYGNVDQLQINISVTPTHEYTPQLVVDKECLFHSNNPSASTT